MNAEGEGVIARTRTGRKGSLERRAQKSWDVVGPGLSAGRYLPLTPREVESVVEAALRLLADVGVADPTSELSELALCRGCNINEHGRLCFPVGIAWQLIAGAAHGVILSARGGRAPLEVAESRVHLGTTGLAPKFMDFTSGKLRSTTLLDLYDFGRLVDKMDNIHYFSRSVVATDVADLLEYDLNVAYACLASTTKHVFSGFTDAKHVEPCVRLLEMIVQSEKGARQDGAPMTVISCPIVSPLRLGTDSAHVIVEAVKHRLPLCLVSASQAGATAPASIGKALAQNLAETLAGLFFVNLLRPGHPVIMGNWPFITDLRTGSFSGGGGEQAVLMAAACQVTRALGLPTSLGAGMTDSKIPDNQAGSEKALSVALGALAGGNMINASAGIYGSLMIGAYEGVVIDNDMYGAIERSIKGIVVGDVDEVVAEVREVVLGPGHFLANRQTLNLMHSEFLYPAIANRMNSDQWVEQGAEDIRAIAKRKASEILKSHYPICIDRRTDERIRERFNIRLPRDAMVPSERW